MTDYIVPVLLFLAAALALGKRENAYDLLLQGGADGLKLLVTILPALVLCVGGYYLYESIITGNFAAPALGIPGYLTQVALSSVVYLVLGHALDRAGLKKKLGEI